MNIAADLDRMAGERPDHPARAAGEEQWTFGELDLAASRVATGLECEGVAGGDRVAIVMGNRFEHVAAWYGVAKAGAVPVDLNFLLSDEEWAYILDDCRPAAVLAGAEYETRMRALAAGLRRPPAVHGEESLARLGSGSGPRPAAERAGGDLAVIAYTSGTTGLPKGVMHDHGRLRHHLEVCRQVIGYGPDDVIANLLPLFPLHAFLVQAVAAVQVGATLVLLPRFDPAALAAASRRRAITTGTFVPAIVIALLSLPAEARPAFQPGSRFNIGGAPLHPEVRDRFEAAFSVTLLQGFGSTEVMGAVAMERAGRRTPWGSCGELFPGLDTKVRVVDGEGRDVPAGEVGEFAVHASRATIGYWENEALTKEAFLDGEWYLMGDLGRIDPDGFVHVLDRKRDMIIRGGFNIYSAEIERVLAEHPGVAEATVVGAADARLGEVPVAFVVLRPPAEPSGELAGDLIATATQRLGKLKAPERVVFVGLGDLPRNAMGKVLKRAVRKQLQQGGS